MATETANHATLSQVNAGIVRRDLSKIDQPELLKAFTPDQLIDICTKAGDAFLNHSLPLGYASHPIARRPCRHALLDERPASYHGEAEHGEDLLPHWHSRTCPERSDLRGVDLNILDSTWRTKRRSGELLSYLEMSWVGHAK